MNITLQRELTKYYQESNMALSSISNTTVTANQANVQKSGTTSEQSENGRTGRQSDNDATGNKFNDNVTLNESVGTPNSEEINVLDTTSAGNLLKNLMPIIMSNSDTAISAQANLSPQAAHALLAD